MSFHKFKDEDGNEYGSFEVFHKSREEVLNDWDSAWINEGGANGGWYWWACFPGCLPDSDPMGPFKTEQEALDDAQENA